MELKKDITLDIIGMNFPFQTILTFAKKLLQPNMISMKIVKEENIA